MKMTYLIALALCFTLSNSAFATEDALVLPGEGQTQTTLVHYLCDGNKTIDVKYIKKGNNSLAILPVAEGNELIFVQTLSGSGSIFSSNEYTWSGKADWMDLTNIIEDSSLHCKAQR